MEIHLGPELINIVVVWIIEAQNITVIQYPNHLLTMSDHPLTIPDSSSPNISSPNHPWIVFPFCSLLFYRRTMKSYMMIHTLFTHCRIFFCYWFLFFLSFFHNLFSFLISFHSYFPNFEISQFFFCCSWFLFVLIM